MDYRYIWVYTFSFYCSIPITTGKCRAIELNNRKLGHESGTLIQYDRCRYQNSEGYEGCPHRKGHLGTQLKDVTPQAKEWDKKKKKVNLLTSWCGDFRLQNCQKNFLLLKPLSLWPRCFLLCPDGPVLSGNIVSEKPFKTPEIPQQNTQESVSSHPGDHVLSGGRGALLCPASSLCHTAHCYSNIKIQNLKCGFY